MKQARVIVRNRQGRHAGGGPERAKMVLKAGKKGTGTDLAICEYWPWSPRSVEAAEDYMYEAAQRQGYIIVYE